KVWTDPIDHLFRGFCHVLGVRPEKLNADWPLDFIEVEIFASALVPPKNSFRRNKLCGENVRAVFLAELAKNFIRHASHRREIERETILKPRQGHISSALFSHKIGDVAPDRLGFSFLAGNNAPEARAIKKMVQVEKELNRIREKVRQF